MGQPCDLGYIDDIKVEYVHEEDEVIYHVTSQKPKNKIVNCKVDLERRIDHTQQHSGEHIMSAAFFKLYKVSNAGFHLGEEYVTIDILLKDISEEMILAAENLANAYVFKNEPVKTYYLQKEEALKLPLRKEIKAEGSIRIVQMGEKLDFSACCGTQVKRTGEIGTIKVVKWEKNKGMTRVYIKCGNRALKDYQAKHNYITEIAKGFSVETNDVVNKVKAQTEEVVSLKKQISNLYGKIASGEAEKLIEKATSKLITAEYSEESFDFLDKLYESLKDKEYILVLSSLKDKKLLLAHNGAFDLDCGKLFKEKLKEYNGRGGGNAKRAQASFAEEADLKNFAEYLGSLELK